MQIHCIHDEKQYGTWLQSAPKRSLWQSLEWKHFQQSLGREVRLYVAEEGATILASALVVIDQTTGGWSTWDIPRGPLWSDDRAVTALLQQIADDAKKDRCLALYVSPMRPLPPTVLGFQPSKRHEQPEATRIVDLTCSNEDLLKQMKPKGRYNIRVAEKHNVQVVASDDTDAFYDLVSQTTERDRFQGLSKSHYEAFVENLNKSFLLLAYDNKKKPVAGLLGAMWAQQGIYYYGASSYAERALMAPYLLQWSAMQLCKENECQSYDLFGIAPTNTPDSHPWQSISAFKEKFGGSVRQYPQEKRLVLRPLAYSMLQMKRKICR